ncbi:MAG TPA: cytochrome c biogenesis protein CcsA [Chloroflexota bacterium]|nr:cytochrome c biogenesis protein CcsA [Chloroflexota bacterium]
MTPRTDHRLGLAVRVGAPLTALLALASLWADWFYAPQDTVQGPAQRIFYVHVPLAWTAFLAFGVVCVASVAYLVTRRGGWDLLARCAAEVGVVLCTAVLATGMLWGKPVWGTWWTWDARLTSTLVLWLIYVAYVMLRGMVEDRERAARYAAVLGIVGALDIPFIHFAVLWWRTLHPQPVVVRADGPALPPTMLATLMLGLITMTAVFVTLLLLRIRVERAAERLEDAAEGAPALTPIHPQLERPLWTAS